HEKNTSAWRYPSDRESQEVKQFMAASGVKNIIYIDDRSALETDIAITGNGLDLTSEFAQADGGLILDERVKNENQTVVAQSQLNRQTRKDQVIELGTRVFFKHYNLLLQNAESGSTSAVVNDEGSTVLFSAFGQYKTSDSKKLSFQCGLNFLHFRLNRQSLMEPRASVRYRIMPNSSFGLSYGLHSRTERLNYYLNRDERNVQQNRNLKLTRSHHFVGTFTHQFNEQLHLRLEPYYQYLFDVPVLAGTAFSFINLENDWFISERLTNTGKGRNFGLDVTLERFMNNGYYYMLTSSVFRSRYRGGDHIWRSTAFDRGFILNGLIGKEWFIGTSSSNVLGLNLRATYQGGQRYIPFDTDASLAAREIVLNEADAFAAQLDATLITHFTFSYRKNKTKSSSVWTLSLINATMVEEFEGFAYNQQTDQIDQLGEALIIPNISYKLEF
ncbi:MAG: prevent-host-death protein, partial [Bacteroidota bacterium]